MRLELRLVLVLLCLLAVTAGATAGGDAPVEIRLQVSDRSRLDELSSMVSITDVRSGEVRALASPGQLERLAAAGFSWTVAAEEKTAAADMCPAGWEYDPDRSWTCYPGYHQYVGRLAALAAAHPTLCRLQALGETANQVRPHRLWAMRISRNPELEEDEPEVFLTAAMHGDEAAGMVLLLRLIDELLESYGSDPEITHLIDSTEIWINPDANPDGTYFRGDDSIAGATRFFTTSGGGWTAVDPNRNFPDPDAGDHPDGHPWWPETEAMMRFASDHTITLSANLHGGAEVVNYPWDTWSRRHPDDAWFIGLARAWADLAHTDGPPRYMTDLEDGITNGYDWYTVHGGRGDFMTFFHGSREVTVEISRDKVPPGDRLEVLWQANRRALLGFIATAGEGLRGVVTGADGEPLAATVELVGHDTTEDASRVATDPDVGDYHRLLLPGVYTVRFAAPGYQTLEMGGITVDAGVTTTLSVALQPEEAGTVTGRVSAAFSAEPVVGATIEVLGTDLDATTDGGGWYTLREVPAGQRTLRVGAAGYVTAEVTADVSPPAVSLDITLRPSMLRPGWRLAPAADGRREILSVPDSATARHGASPHGQRPATPLR